MFYDIVRVAPLPGPKLHLVFRDGTEGVYDLCPHVSFTGVFAPLADEAEFRKVRVNREIGTIEWPNDLDLDPIVLYAQVAGKAIEDVLASTAVR